jgi:hypothetical protein
MSTRKRVTSRPQPARTWSIRAKIIAVLAVPLLTLIAMWIVTTAITLGPGLNLLDARNNLDNIGHPAQSMIAELQAERKLSFAYIAGGRKDNRALLAQRAQTQTAVDAFRRLAGSEDTRNAATDLTSTRLNELFLYLDSMTQVRADVDSGQMDRATALRRYTEIIDSSFGVYDSTIRVSNEDLARESRAVLSLGRARELLAQEDAVVSGALAAGVFPGGDLGQAVQLIGAQRFLFAQTQPDLFQADRVDYEALAASQPYTSLVTLENRLISDARANAPAPIDATSWRAAYDKVSSDLQHLELVASDRLVDRGKPVAAGIITRIVVTGLLGLIVIIGTAIASVRIGRNLIRRLAGLRQAALELAVDRLPRVVTRLRVGEEVDVAAEAPPLPYGDDEIGEVGRAFNELQRVAIHSAVEEANVRRGVNEVFLNIARRSQTLLHRQLSILDRMERRVEDPVELEDLFRVDHLATRMRRHAEDLVILAGASPGRGWRNPIPLVDVLRGAASEVEDYARVSIRPMPEVALAGRGVGDVIHLLAELIENATSFSPPHTRVSIGSEMVSNGLAVEIEDRGLGMSPEALSLHNARLADPPNFDPANSAQLGLFVVARLAERHGVRVQLRSSPYGGITAVALIPDSLVVPVGGEGPITRRELVTAEHRAIAPTPHATTVTTASTPLDAREQFGADGPGVIVATPGKPIPRHAADEVIEAVDDNGGDGLPRRVRQRNLAPQLREDATDVDNATQPPSTRSPEQLRAMMTSFQAGMARGRQDADATDVTAERDTQ